MFLSGRLARALVFASGRRQQRIHAIAQTAIEVIRLEFWRDDRVDDLLGRAVRNRTLESVTHLDPDLAVVDKDEQGAAIVQSCATHLPALKDPVAVVLDRRICLRLSKDGD